MLIDSHLHLGSDRVYDVEVTEQELWESMEEHSIEMALVQPMTVTPDMRSQCAAHDRVAAFAHAHPERVRGVAYLNPHCDRRAYASEICRCVQDLGFVGVKLHPATHACYPNSRDGNMVFEVANELGMPVIVHTGAGIPAALPSTLIPLARRFPELKIVVAHAGMILLAEDALVAATECENLYLETSWSTPHTIRLLLEVLGSRVMFGSDDPANVGAELAKARFLSANLPAQVMDDWLWRTAARVFRLSVDADGT